MIHFRFNQGWQKVMEDVQHGAFRPTFAEKVRRLEMVLSLNPSDLLTSSNLAAHIHIMRTRVYIRARIMRDPVYPYIRLGG